MRKRSRWLFGWLALMALALLAQPVLAAPVTPQAGDTVASVRAPLPAMQFAEGTYMKAIQDRGVLRAGVKQDVLLFGYLNPRTNRIEGFDVDVVKEIARALLGDSEAVDLRGMPSAARIPSLREDIVDIVVSTMTITKARLEEIDFSDVYYESGQMLLVPRSSSVTGIQDTAGKRICAAKGSTSELNITRFQPAAEVVQADLYSECLLAVQQGRADGVSTDDVILMGLAEQDPSMKLVGGWFTQEPYGIGVAKGRSEFVDFVNSVLTDMKSSGRWAAIYSYWLGRYTETPAPPSRTAAEAAV